MLSLCYKHMADSNVHAQNLFVTRFFLQVVQNCPERKQVRVVVCI